MEGVTLLTNIEEDNIKAFERMLDEKESLEKQNKNHYRYFEDLYGNQYRWTIYKQDDDKFHAIIMKAVRRDNWVTFRKSKERAFTKRKTAKNYCIKAYHKAKNHQKIVLDTRANRKQERLDAKPKFTKEELNKQKTEKDISHYNKMIAKTDTKIKSLTTRRKTYERRIKVLERRWQKQVLI